MERNQSGDKQVQLTRLAVSPEELARETFRLIKLSEGGGGWFADLAETARNLQTELYAEDVGWTRLGVGDTRGLSGVNRVEAVKRSRTFATFDALCKQTIQLYTVYAIGDGIQWNVRDKKNGQPLLNQIINSVANRRKFDAQGQRKTSTKLLVDGEVFWAIFLASKVGDSKLRQIDPMQITDIATDPDDEETPRFYKREWRRGGKNHAVWYADYTNEDGRPGEDSRGNPITRATDPNGALIYHATLDGMGMRGEPLLTASLDEAEANRQFLRARLAIVLSLAQFAWVVKIKGGQAAVNTMTAAQGSTLGDSGEETHPPAAFGSTWVENLGATRTPIKQESGAESAQVDGGMFLQRFGAGVFVYPHYYGAGEAFRLATASAMELPMHKNFAAFRRLQYDMYGGIFDFLFEKAGIEDRYIDPELPPIVPKDVGKLIHAVAEIGTTMPRLLLAPEVQKLVLTYLGIDNVDEVLNEIDKLPESEPQMAEVLRSIARDFKRVVELQEGGVT